MNFLKVKSSVFLLLLLVGCSPAPQNLPNDIFKEVKEIEKPEIKTFEDIQKGYIKLFDAYKNNLNLLKLLESANKK